MLGMLRIKSFFISMMLCSMSLLFGAQAGDRGNTRNLSDAVTRGNLDAVAYWVDNPQPVGSNALASALLSAVGASFMGDEDTRLKVVQLLLDRGAPIESSDNGGRTPLMLAVAGGHLDAAKILLERGADITVRSRQGGNILSSVPMGNVAFMRFLLDNKFDIETKDLQNRTILMHAVRYNDVPMVAFLLERQADTEVKGSDGDSPLLMAVRFGYVDIIKLLLDAKANIEIKDKHGNTPLLMAVQFGYVDIVKLLLDAKANIEARNKSGDTALMIAFEEGKYDDVISLLLAAGASFTAKEITDFIYRAVSATDERFLRSLESRGFNVTDVLNRTMDNGEMLLTQYVIANNCPVVAMLLAHGADPLARNAAGLTAFDYVRAQKKNSKMLALFNEKFPEELVTLEPALSISSKDLPFGSGNTPTEIHYKHFSVAIEQAQKYGKVLEDPIVQECIAKERIAYEEDKYVFYHAEPGKYRAYQYLLQELDDLVKSFGKTTRDFIFTRFIGNAAREMTINDYIDTEPWREEGIRSTKNVLLSASMALFGNVYNDTSCAWHFFLRNTSITSVSLQALFESLFDHYGFDKQYIEELRLLQEGAFNASASLLQIIVPKNIVDNVVMLADVGYCVPWPDIVDPSCWAPQAISADGKQGRHTCIASIIDKYRAEAIPINDKFQVRIFMNAAYGLNPNSGITFNLYSRLPKASIVQLKERIHAIADKIFGQWLADLVMRADRPLLISSEELRAMLKHYGKGDVARQAVFFEAFKKKLEVLGEERKDKADKTPVQEMGHAVAQVAARVAHEEIISDARKGVGVRSDAAQLKAYVPATILQEYRAGKTLAIAEMLPLYVKDCARDTVYNARIAKKTARVARIATYNVHLWKDAIGADAYQDILHVIAQIQADILVLQEVLLFDEAQVKKDLAALGYVYPPIFEPMGRIGGVQFGTMIVSKYPFIQPPLSMVYAANSSEEKRNFINAKIRLPNGLVISLYGTHLDPWDETGAVREKQVRELLEYVQKNPDDNVILAGDWNAVRRSDYEYTVGGKSVWDMQTEQFLKRVPTRLRLREIPTQALQDIERAGFKDCFTAAGIAGPKYTVWTGTVVDFIFCAQKWNLPIDGCYLYFSAVSDHLPVIMDVRITKTKFAKEQDSAPQAKKGQVQKAAEGDEEEKKWAQEE
ncbi:MAG TPA: ankyrin repeat domain-containing protein [Candidatus Babeliales bacterium]|nr:ankyrin repeat domain-containing protein [Candidatus Babeliales bacterium]